jgi:hypothetical protein
MKPQRHWLFAALMLGMGLFLLRGIRPVFPNWDRFGPALQLVFVLFLIAGAALLISGLLTLFSRSLRRAAAWGAAGAFLLAGVTQLGGVLSAVIPCGGPS